MNCIVCKKCGSSMDMEENSEIQIKFCNYCGAPIHNYVDDNLKRIDDDLIIDNLVKAFENEMYNNVEKAEKAYKQILKVRPGFAPAQRGLVRLSYEDEDEDIDEYIIGLKDNVTISFTSIRANALTVSFDGRDDIVLKPGETKGVVLVPVYQRICFKLGLREYYAYIDFVDDDTNIRINYVFNGRNHIKIVDDKGNDYSESVR